MSDKRAAIPRPTICRMVVVRRKDGEHFAIGNDLPTPTLVTEAPATVVRVEVDADLATLVLVGSECFCAPHAELAPADYPGRALVWFWPPRVS